MRSRSLQSRLCINSSCAPVVASCFFGKGESRPPQCLGPAGCCSAEAGGSERSAKCWGCVASFMLLADRSAGQQGRGRAGRPVRQQHERRRQLFHPEDPGLRRRCDDINYYGRTVAVRNLLKGRKYNQNKAVEGFDKVNNSRTPRTVHQSGYADVRSCGAVECSAPVRATWLGSHSRRLTAQ